MKSKLSKQQNQDLYSFLADGITFYSSKAPAIRGLYFPLCATDAKGIKSSISSRLSGDIKIDKNRYLTKPVSTEDLRLNVRNFYCAVQDKGLVALVNENIIDAAVEAGLLWHKYSRRDVETGLAFEAINFIPISGETVELMQITVENMSKKSVTFTPTFCLPVFARALANKHDHEHVTSLLNRIEQLPNGVCVKPSMSFDERGHKPNEDYYYVLGADAQGNNPVGTYPTVESFYGDGGDSHAPQALLCDQPPSALARELLDGKEAMGALQFAKKQLDPGDHVTYLIMMGISPLKKGMDQTFGRFGSQQGFQDALDENKTYWKEKVQAIRYSTGNNHFDAWMRWVTLQPVLRRIFGCSFMPDHDYGKGGKGWRDIWQDLLSLILIEPQCVRETLVHNFAGVRIDGTNATIIGSTPGEFIADRNAITRVWMDHGVWPLTTLLLYVHQTGDYAVLFEECTYFRDVQLSRAHVKDHHWEPKQGNFLTDEHVQIYKGTILEHILVEHLVQFFNVGEHNIIRLEDADWNDGLDMAHERGESVAFTSFYGGNLASLADLLERMAHGRKIQDIVLAAEVKLLLDTLLETPVNYNDARAKSDYLFQKYFPSVQPHISGKRINVPVKDLINDLRVKSEWIFTHIKKNEHVSIEEEGQAHLWFNGYYDNAGNCVEGKTGGRVRMTLSGQVFPVMSGLASDEECADIIQSVDRFLKDQQFRGYRLNTNFGIDHYMDMGRAFGFAYGTKENGAFFSHMNVMYAYALYKRGFVREGYEVIRSIYAMCMDTEKSKIYPGVPEYFNSEGRGFYHYLTGAASWLVLTQLTQVFGVRGEQGDLCVAPKLVKEQFDAHTGKASVSCTFAGKKIDVSFENPAKLDYGSYGIGEVYINGTTVQPEKNGKNAILIKREVLERGPNECALRVVLSAI